MKQRLLITTHTKVKYSNIGIHLTGGKKRTHQQQRILSVTIKFS